MSIIDDSTRNTSFQNDTKFKFIQLNKDYSDI